MCSMLSKTIASNFHLKLPTGTLTEKILYHFSRLLKVSQHWTMIMMVLIINFVNFNITPMTIDKRRRRSLPNQGTESADTLIHRGSVVGVYIQNIDRPMPVIGTTTNTVDNIGLCQTEQIEAATTINCSMGANEVRKMLHVQAVIG